MFSPSKYSRRFQNKKSAIQRTPTRKLVIFEVAGETYAIAIERVQRVLTEFTTQGTLEGGRSLVKIDADLITLLDLSQLFVTPNDSQEEHSYLIVCTLTNGDRIGIPLQDLPAILDIPEDKFAEIPVSYRQGKEGQKSAPAAVEKIITTPAGTVAFYLNLDKLLD
ncbi:chemotaxis protein CheW [Phormidium pseudopriestleyi FRX01]|uniref:Chemotaxis protein CheW n=1 Tax=Phormidium pseudopriestleyi FRX01 TaxID=1759528 RepID=A0ABS3FT23_9CYAN|nr:chemotaxis protein CheW [Phormidium pseudopriestleyi]MBO0350256.1 chemotaxis protein CheW [Phormidium pseudopriestleyi FRX01]